MQLLKHTNLVFIAVLFTFMCIAAPAAAQNECGFSNWDGNGDSYVDDSEFGSALEEEGYYDAWDTNMNGTIDEEEWQTGADQYLTDYDYGTYTDWDADSDGTLTEEEFNDGLFGIIDEDDDSMIAEEEWDMFDTEEDGLFC